MKGVHRMELISNLFLLLMAVLELLAMLVAVPIIFFGWRDR